MRWNPLLEEGQDGGDPTVELFVVGGPKLREDRGDVLLYGRSRHEEGSGDVFGDDRPQLFSHQSRRRGQRRAYTMAVDDPQPVAKRLEPLL
jgi:hypothetical protein